MGVDDIEPAADALPAAEHTDDENIGRLAELAQCQLEDGRNVTT
jgi:hypothetical protein